MNYKEEKKAAEKLWARNKYLVLSKSHKYYLSIRDYLKLEEVNVETVESFIDRAKSLRESPKDVVNAYQHIWGYFKDDASIEEKEKFLGLLDQYKNGEVDKNIPLSYLKDLLKKYPNDYLENSTIFEKANS